MTKSTEYEVDVKLGICSCFVGSKGRPCKHQHCVLLGKKIESHNIVPQTKAQKEYYHYIATGFDAGNLPEKWYNDLLVTPEKSQSGPQIVVEDVTCKSDLFHREEENNNNNCEVEVDAKNVWENHYKTVAFFEKKLQVFCNNNPKDFDKAMQAFASKLDKFCKLESSFASSLLRIIFCNTKELFLFI